MPRDVTPLSPAEIELWKARARPWPAYDGFFGNVFHRAFHFDQQGEMHVGDTHNHDHVTVLGPGCWFVHAVRPGGEVIKRSFIVPERQFVVLNIRKDTWHEITDLVGGGQMGCVFATREQLQMLEVRDARAMAKLLLDAADAADAKGTAEIFPQDMPELLKAIEFAYSRYGEISTGMGVWSKEMTPYV